MKYKIFFPMFFLVAFVLMGCGASSPTSSQKTRQADFVQQGQPSSTGVGNETPIIIDWVNINSPAEDRYCYAYFEKYTLGYAGYGYSGVECSHLYQDLGQFVQVEWERVSPIPGADECYRYQFHYALGYAGYGYAGVWCMN